MVAVLLSMVFWGAGCVQSFYYFQRYPKDSLWIKSMVIAVTLHFTVHEALICHACYSYLITWYGHVEFLNTITNSLKAATAIAASNDFIVELFFIWRVWRLSKHNAVLTTFLVVQAITAFIFFVIFTAKFARLPSLFDLPTLQKWAISFNAVGASCDVCITLSLIWLLHWSRSGVVQTDRIVNKLILFSLNTCLVTSLCSLASLITLVTMPDNLIFIIFFFNISKLLINCLLVTLNTRKSATADTVDTNHSMRVFNISKCSPFHGSTAANSYTGFKSTSKVRLRSRD